MGSTKGRRQWCCMQKEFPQVCISNLVITNLSLNAKSFACLQV
jgi:hypothetical protein